MSSSDHETLRNIDIHRARVAGILSYEDWYKYSVESVASLVSVLAVVAAVRDVSNNLLNSSPSCLAPAMRPVIQIIATLLCH